MLPGLDDAASALARSLRLADTFDEHDAARILAGVLFLDATYGPGFPWRVDLNALARADDGGDVFVQLAGGTDAWRRSRADALAAFTLPEPLAKALDLDPGRGPSPWDLGCEADQDEPRPAPDGWLSPRLRWFYTIAALRAARPDVRVPRLPHGDPDTFEARDGVVHVFDRCPDTSDTGDAYVLDALRVCIPISLRKHLHGEHGASERLVVHIDCGECPEGAGTLLAIGVQNGPRTWHRL